MALLRDSVYPPVPPGGQLSKDLRHICKSSWDCAEKAYWDVSSKSSGVPEGLLKYSWEMALKDVYFSAKTWKSMCMQGLLQGYGKGYQKLPMDSNIFVP